MATVRKPSSRDWITLQGKLRRSFATKANSYSVKFYRNSKLTEVVNAAKQVQSKRWIVQLMQSADYKEKTESWIKRLDWHIRSFMVSEDPYYSSGDTHGRVNRCSSKGQLHWNLQ